MEEKLKRLDHPLLFLVFITLAVTATSSLLTFLFKKLGWSGPAALVQHP